MVKLHCLTSSPGVDSTANYVSACLPLCRSLLLNSCFILSHHFKSCHPCFPLLFSFVVLLLISTLLLVRFQASWNGNTEEGEIARPTVIPKDSTPSASATLKARLAATAAASRAPQPPQPSPAVERTPKAADLPPPTSDSWETTEPVVVSRWAYAG